MPLFAIATKIHYSDTMGSTPSPSWSRPPPVPCPAHSRLWSSWACHISTQKSWNPCSSSPVHPSPWPHCQVIFPLELNEDDHPCGDLHLITDKAVDVPLFGNCPLPKIWDRSSSTVLVRYWKLRLNISGCDIFLIFHYRDSKFCRQFKSLGT